MYICKLYLFGLLIFFGNGGFFLCECIFFCVLLYVVEEILLKRLIGFGDVGVEFLFVGVFLIDFLIIVVEVRRFFVGVGVIWGDFMSELLFMRCVDFLGVGWLLGWFVVLCLMLLWFWFFFCLLGVVEGIGVVIVVLVLWVFCYMLVFLMWEG